jgi:ribosome biogenesis GTPase A
LLNKSDLCEEKVNREWFKVLSREEIKVLPVNSLTGDGLRSIKPSLDELLKEKIERLKNKGLANFTARVMVVGIPNVGKSSFINKMARNNVAKTGDKPGVTKNKQWIKTGLGMELLDTPGILWPRFEDEEVALNLAFTGAIKDEVMDIEELALKLVERLKKYYPENLLLRYKLETVSEDPLENLDNIARKRGMIAAGSRVDYNRLSIMLLDEFRGGKIGKISLERP